MTFNSVRAPGAPDPAAAAGSRGISPDGTAGYAKWRGLAYALACALIWGVQPVVLRVSVFDGLTTADVTVLRFAVSALLLLPVALQARPIPVGPLGWPRTLVLTALIGPPFSLVLIAGTAFAPGFHNAVITNGLIPVAAMLLAFLVTGEGPRPGKLAGIVLVAIGIAVFTWQTARGAPGREGAWRGDVLFVVGSFMWALFGLLAQRWRIQALQTTAGVSLISLAATPILAALLPMHLAQAGFSAVLLQALYQGVLIGVVASLLYMRAVILLGAVRAALVLPLIPAITTLTGFVVLGETPSAWETAGMLIVVAGMALAFGGRDR